MNYNVLKLTDKDIEDKTIQGYIALFDILGYRQWIKERSLKEVVTVHENMKHVVRINIESFLNQAFREKVVRVYSYADTFLIYTNQICATGLKTIMSACRGMFEAAIWFGLPIRGAVTSGEFYSSENTITGKPLIEAFKMEQEQDWIGCWIANACFDKITEEEKETYEKDKIVVRYLIPFQSRCVEEVYAYNWVEHAIQNPRDINLNYLMGKSFLQKAKAHNWREQRKIKNTIEFYNFIKNMPLWEASRGR